jgi:uncharacterized protein
MPLLVSPIDGKTPMQQIIRDGIEIDRCPVSGGVWLDAGELEKLLNGIQKAVYEDREDFVAYRQSQPKPAAYHGRGYKYDDDYDDYYKRKYGSKSKLKKLFDLFD